MMNETKEGLKTIFKTENELTMPVSAPGSAGMETCLKQGQGVQSLDAP
jgi:alanine-glyoxylate transaminase/serine-glyoxylate transaminase/serine-pyruvate transaminase